LLIIVLSYYDSDPTAMVGDFDIDTKMSESERREYTQLQQTQVFTGTMFLLVGICLHLEVFPWIYGKILERARESKKKDKTAQDKEKALARQKSNNEAGGG
jgi:hypothetical protein